MKGTCIMGKMREDRGKKSINEFVGEMKTGGSKKHIHLGTINEHRAIIEFLSKGCEVFTNVKQHGCIDIVVIHPDGKTEKLDIKTRCERKRDHYPIHRSLTEEQKKLGVRLYYIDKGYKGHYHPPKGVK